MSASHAIKSFAYIFVGLISPLGYTDEGVDSIPLGVAIVTAVVALITGALLVMGVVAYFS